MILGLVALAAAAIAAPAPAPSLPGRVDTIVLHTLGGPFYGKPEMRFVFLSPVETFALWGRPGFGAHWIVAPDGRVWPRHPEKGEPSSSSPPADLRLTDDWRARIAREAAPVYAHAAGVNRESVGIELAHSGRSGDAFPPAQIRSVAFLIRSLLEMSGGRLTEACVIGHKDVDTRPAYVVDDCRGPSCAYYVDESGLAYRRRVDPPEGLFVALAGVGLVVPRPAGKDDELRRAERLGTAAPPAVFQP
jgi:hypothetical protein